MHALLRVHRYSPCRNIVMRAALSFFHLPEEVRDTPQVSLLAPRARAQPLPSFRLPPPAAAAPAPATAVLPVAGVAVIPTPIYYTYQ
eukprot:COSAG01_NODE_4923_length_4615_cov_3.525232_7_plen_87_part_00